MLQQLIKKLKLPLEVISVVLGIVLGVMAIWQQVKPSGDLVAQLVLTEARLPADIISRSKALPQLVEDDLTENKEFLKLLPELQTREEALRVIKDTVGRRSFSLHGLEGIRREFMFVKVRNEGVQPLVDVKLGLRHPVTQSATIVRADGTLVDIEAAGVVSLGDLPPHGEVKLFAWGLAFLVSKPEDITVSHSGGVGEVEFLTPVPRFIWGNEGVFFSYRHTTYALLALILITIGVVGIIHVRSRRGSESV